MKMQTRDPRWFLLGAAAGVVVTAIYYFSYTRLLGLAPDQLNLPYILLFFLVIAQLVALAGYMNFKVLLVASSLGLVGGLVAMVWVLSAGSGGWEDLVAFIIMMQLIIAGFILGGVVELTMWLRTLYLKNRE